MEDDLHHPPCLLVLSKGAQAITTLPELLSDYQLLNGTPSQASKADVVLAWGRKPSAKKAEAVALRAKVPVITVEDGFLRSVGLGADEPPLSLVVDHLGIYYDASTPSRLEQLIAQPLSDAQTERARDLQLRWQANKVSKYNAARIETFESTQPSVLVADQTFGDSSLQGAGPAEFQRMLQAALAEHPQCKILLKVHPDVVAGRKQGHFDLDALRHDPRIEILARDIHPADLLPAMQAVYVMTSQMGFDALLWNVPVHTFGMPFYAGWGLTTDAQPAPSRRAPAALEQVIHAALVQYPRYINPETGKACTPEVLIDWMGLQRRKRSSLPAGLNVVGFTRWKLPLAEQFFNGSQLNFVGDLQELDSSTPVLSWGCKTDAPLQSTGLPVIRVEDGFLRSVGLGAGKTRPLSWVVDDLGIYYDATRPSRLEHILQSQDSFSPSLLTRAAALREAICTAGVTKYNLTGSPWKRPAGVEKVILVTGQVESDASIHFGANTLRSNLALLKAVRERNPRAWVLYKPHPEVLAGTRAAGDDEAQTVQWCNQVIGDTPFNQLLEVVDEVHVLTSQSGFEALMRGIPVTTYGQPFYAGWGLTTDVDMNPATQARRQRRLSLDELVAGTLILYPTYVSRITHRFTTPEQTLLELRSWHELPEQGKQATWLEMIKRWTSGLNRHLSLVR
jgi:capsular polysaccharide export protein